MRPCRRCEKSSDQERRASPLLRKVANSPSTIGRGLTRPAALASPGFAPTSPPGPARRRGGRARAHRLHLRALADAPLRAPVAALRRRFGHPSAERALSGPGLVNLHTALCEIEGLPVSTLSAADSLTLTARQERWLSSTGQSAYEAKTLTPRAMAGRLPAPVVAAMPPASRSCVRAKSIKLLWSVSASACPSRSRSMPVSPVF